MAGRPLVSCVVIFFNAGETFFVGAIESVLAQTYSEWELLLVDDGSTDESTGIALEYARQVPGRITYLQHEGHENRGMSAARNLGIAHAKGAYVAFLDADDLWLSNKLEEQVAILEGHPEAAMLYGRSRFWFSWMENNPCVWVRNSNDTPGDFLTETSDRFDVVIEPPAQLMLFLQNKEIYPCTCSVLIRRSVFDEVGRFEEGFRNAHEDMVFHSKVFLKAPVFVSSECWDLYRIHPDSFWRTADREGRGTEMRRAGFATYLKWLERYLTERKDRKPRGLVRTEESTEGFSENIT